MKLSRIIRPHSLRCRAKGKAHEWSGVLSATQPSFWGNFAANPNAKVGRYHLWYNVMCNDAACTGRKVVHSSVLANA